MSGGIYGRKKSSVPDFSVDALESRVLYSADAVLVATIALPDTEVLTPATNSEAASTHDANKIPKDLSELQLAFNTVDTLVIIDADVDNVQALLEDIANQADQAPTVVVLDKNNVNDALTQLTRILSQFRNVTALHVVSHGNDGELMLGGERLSTLDLLAHTGQISTWRDSFASDADILLYGCELAASDDGKNFADTLARLTGADVAASIDLTGNAVQQGNWQLEYASGAIEHESVFSDELRQTYTQTLAIHTVTDLGDSGVNTLRWAIDQANTGAGGDSIEFSSAGTITVLSALPTLLKPVTIDATLGTGYSGTPVVTLDGTSAGAGVNGLNFNSGSDDSTVRGLTIINFSNNGIYADDVSNLAIESNYIGTDGTTNLGNTANGISLSNVSASSIGGSGVGNVISGNTETGVLLSGVGTNLNVVRGNWIGIAQDGGSVLGNNLDGVSINNGASSNTIGGSVSGEGNVISGNTLSGVALADDGTTNNSIVGNLIGTDIYGLLAVGNGSGVYIGFSASSNSVGGNGDAGEGNIISGNSDNGVVLTGAGTNANVVRGNLIGADVTGAVDLGNAINGVLIDAMASNNIIGGGAAGQGNVLSGNNDDGIAIGDSGTTGNQVFGNLIGVAQDGSSVLANSRDGVNVNNGASANAIGGSAIGEGNVISGNTLSGIGLLGDGTTANLIVGNLIGTDFNGVSAVGNGAGVYIGGGASVNTIGGDNGTGEGNLISGNRGFGINIIGASTAGNRVLGNFIGTAANGSDPLGNGSDGVIMNGSPSSIIGGSAVGARNVISANVGDGIEVTGAGATGTQILGNRIGTNAEGTADLGNGYLGIRIRDGASGTVVGGNSGAGEGNLVSGNDSGGLMVDGADSSVIQGNRIGTGVNGIVALGNSGAGVAVSGGSLNTQVGGNSTVGLGNLVSGHTTSVGISVDGVTTADTWVYGNVVGAVVDGSTALGNLTGIQVNDTVGTLVGSIDTGEGNLVSGNIENGIVVLGAAGTGVQIMANRVGTNAGGTASNANGRDGILISGSQLVSIGGGSIAHANVVSGNAGNGILVNTSNDVHVLGNHIGTSADGTVDIGNMGIGVLIENGSIGNLVGGTTLAETNIIRASGGAGIAVTDAASTNNVFLLNTIAGNNGLGIDLGTTGIQVNDSQDADSGANGLQNYPVLTQVVTDAAGLTLVEGFINSTPNTDFRVDLYASAMADALGYGEAERYKGTSFVTTDAGGAATFSIALSATVLPDEVVSATLTSMNSGLPQSTSEFSANTTNKNTPNDIAAIGASIVSNGSFESGINRGTPTAWTFSGAGGLSTNNSIRSSEGGNYFSLNGWSTAAGGVLSQTLITKAGSTYQLQFDAGAAGDGSVPQVLNVQVFDGGAVLLDQTITDTSSSGSWTTQGVQRYLYTFTATSTSTLLQFTDNSAGSTGNDLDLDNVQVYVVENPVVSENAAVGLSVTTVTGSDPDDRDTLTYSLTNNSGGRFAIDSDTGEIIVTDSERLNFEIDASHTITVRATDVDGLTYDETITIDVADMAEAPQGVVVQSTTVLLDENFDDGDAIGWDLPSGVGVSGGKLVSSTNERSLDMLWSDPAALGWTDYSITTQMEVFDNDAQGLIVRAQDSLNYILVHVQRGTNNVYANQVVGGVSANIGSATGLGVDAGNNDKSGVNELTIRALGDQFTVELNGVDVLSFTDSTFLSGTVGLYVSAQALQSSFDNIRVTEAPVVVVENSSNGTAVGYARGLDADAGTTLIYTLSNTAGGRFAIEGSTGQITVADGSLLNFDTATSHDIDIQVTDAAGNSYTETVAIAISADVAPTNIVTTSTTDGGLTINGQSGLGDSYLQADNGGDILGGLGALTVEWQFESMGVSNGSDAIIQYSTATQNQELYIHRNGGGDLKLVFRGTSIDITSFDYNSLDDGQIHSLAFSWDNTDGDWVFYVDGNVENSGTGLAATEALTADGDLVFGQQYSTYQGAFVLNRGWQTTLHDIRIFADVRTASEIAASYRSDLAYDEENMLANWQFENLSVDGLTADSVSGNNLTIGQTDNISHVADTPVLTFVLDENALDGAVIGQVSGLDAHRDVRIAALLAADSALSYSAETNKFYRLTDTNQTWAAGSGIATSTALSGVNGQMATIRSANENAIVTVVINGGTAYLGGSDATVEGEHRWIEKGVAEDQFWRGDNTGYDLAFSNWQSGEPGGLASHDYLRIESDGTWTDGAGTHNRKTVIEWNADEVLDTTDSLTYAIASQSVAGAFKIDISNGQIIVADGVLLDFETNATHTLAVRITDIEANSYDQSFTVSLGDVFESSKAPTNLSSGIELNTDGGNDAYLIAVDGGAIFGGLDAFTYEISFATDYVDQQILVSYASADSLHNSFLIQLESNGVANIFIDDVASGNLTGIDYRSLMDGNVHQFAVSWDSTNGDWALYVDGQLTDSGTGLATGRTIDGSVGTGDLVFGQEQDALDGSYNSNQTYSGTLYDVRVWNTARSQAEIALTYQHKLDLTASEALAIGLVANWQMDGFDVSNEVVDIVSGNNLSSDHAAGTGFITSTPVGDLHVAENVFTGTAVGFVRPSAPYVANDIVNDGVFTEASDPGGFQYYGTAASLGGWTVEAGDVELFGTYFGESPQGGRSVDMNGSVPGTLLQALAVEEGRQYQVSFAINGNYAAGDSNRSLMVSADGQSVEFNHEKEANWAKEAPVWEYRSFTFIASGTSADLRFQSLNSDADGAVVADVQVIEIPQAISTILSKDSILSNYTFSLINDADSRFAIDANTGEISVAARLEFDFESATSHDVAVNVAESSGESYTQTIAIAVGNRIDANQSVPGAQSVDEDIALVFSASSLPANAVTVSDSIAGSDSPLQVSIDVDSGVLTLSQTTGLSIIEGSDGSAFMTIDGLESAINAAFEGMTFTPDSNISGSVALNIATSLSADLQAHYTFENGNAIDQSAGALQNGTLIGNATTVVDGARGDVLSLDGNGDSVRITGLFGEPNDVTLSAWVSLNIADLQGAEVISLGNSIQLRLDNPTDGIALKIRNATSWTPVSSGLYIAGDGWHHVAATFDDTNNVQVIYLDGEVVATGSLSDSIDYNLGSDTVIGGHGDNAPEGYDFNGLIDDARIFTRALSAEEIATLASDPSVATGSMAINVDSLNDAPTAVVPAVYLSDTTPSGESNIHGGVMNDRAWISGAVEIDGVQFPKAISTHAPSSGVGYVDYEVDGATSFKSTIGIADNYDNATYGTVIFRVYVDSVLQYTSPTLSSSSAPTDLDIDTTGGTTLRLEVDRSSGGNGLDHASWANARFEGGIIGLVVVENSANGAVVGSVNRADVDRGDNATYTLLDNAGGRFSIAPDTGEIMVLDGSLLNFEATRDYDITIEATDVGGLAFDQVLAIKQTDVNENSTAILVSGPGVNLFSDGSFESGAMGWSLTGNVVAIGARTPTDGSQQLLFSRANSANNGVASQSIATEPGEIYTVIFDYGPFTSGEFDQTLQVEVIGSGSLLNQSLLSKGTNPTDHRQYAYTFVADSESTLIRFSDISTRTTGVDIDLDNVRIYAGTPTVEENVVGGIVVSRLAANDPDDKDDVTYSLVGGDTTNFEIVGNEILVKSGANIDFEAAATRTVTARSTDETGLTFDQDIEITIIAVNEIPIAVADTDNAVEAGGVGNATAGNDSTGNVLTNDTDVDAGDTKAVSGVVAGSVGSTSIDVGSVVVGQYGSIVINSDGSYTYTIDNKNTVVQALADSSNRLVDVFTYAMSDSGGLESTAQFTVTIQGANDAPVITSNGGGATAVINVNENQTAVTTVTATDADGEARQTYSLTERTDASAFSINPSTGVLSFRATPDHESQDVYEVEVAVSDGVLKETQLLNIFVADVNEFSVTALVDTDGIAGAVVAENLTVGSPVGITATASDTDSTMNIVSYTLVDNTDGLFAINEATGVVSLTRSLDAEATLAHRLTITALSMDGSTSTSTFTVNVTDVNEFGLTQVVDNHRSQGGSVQESSATGTQVGIVAMATDADVTDSTVSYTLTDNSDGAFAIDAESGVVTVAGKLDAEIQATHVVIVLATSEDGSSTSMKLDIRVVDENDNRPVLMPDQYFDIAENSVAGVDIGIVDSADVDTGDTLSDWRIDGGSGLGIFEIDPDSGMLSVANNAALDFEMQDEYSLVISVSDTLNRSEAVQASIHITNINEAPLIANVTFTVFEGYKGQLGTIEATEVDDGDRMNFTVSEYGDVLSESNLNLQQTGLLSVQRLPVGIHDISVQVTDLGGLSNSANIRIEVQADVVIETDLAPAKFETIRIDRDFMLKDSSSVNTLKVLDGVSGVVLESALPEPEILLTSRPSIHSDGSLHYDNTRTIHEAGMRQRLTDIAANDSTQQGLELNTPNSYALTAANNASFRSQQVVALSLEAESDEVSLAAAFGIEASTRTFFPMLSRDFDRSTVEVEKSKVLDKIGDQASEKVREYVVTSAVTVAGGSLALGSIVWLLRAGALVATVTMTGKLFYPVAKNALLSSDSKLKSGTKNQK